jgi:hypothetical protein
VTAAKKNAEVLRRVAGAVKYDRYGYPPPLFDGRAI